MKEIVESAEEVFDKLGPGWTESIYHRAMEVELSSRGIEFSSEGTIPVIYKGKPVGRRRPDMFIETDDGMVVTELKSGSSSGKEQLLDYQNILGDDSNFEIAEGILIRFNEELEIMMS